MDLRLSGRCYVVTGASRGLGRATAAALAAEGARVVLNARSVESLAATVGELGAGSAEGVPGDLADPALADRLVAAALSRFGRLDGALVSVGGPPGGGVLDVTDEQWRAAFDAIFVGAVRVARTVAAVCGEGGAVGLVLSTSVKAPIGGLAVSNGLRPGLAMVAKTLADEVGPRGVRVLGLLPGRVATDRVAELDAATGDPDAARERAAAGIPLRRYGEPAEFGRVAAFLLSPAASYITGCVVPVDGGATRAL
ncbi:MAG TPA: SDR family oxidoreductase [Mycobacteriales bacterium]|jgi:3-oxoacyl-[acyl-carrier protein] reductase|nr:SDR family oxidoreductase [Mycobacteriales bacterium]